MATLIADSPPAPASETQPTPPDGGVPAAPDPGTPPPSAARGCARCSSPLAPGQDWCLQCGAGAPGSLGTPAWRSAATILGAVAVLVLGAAAAGYAALAKGARKAPVLTTTVAQVPAPAAPVTAPLGTPTTKTTLPVVPVKPPKIPLTTTTPKPASTTPSTTTTNTSTTTTPSSTTTGGATPSEETQPTAILLDTNAASTYNPYSYPASNFGDPSLAIDGDTSTSWTAQLDPTTAPALAEGLLIDLNIPQKLSALTLVTSSPGMTIQVYGANGTAVPNSITAPGWTRLSRSMVVHKRHEHITLRESKHAFRFVTVWISKAPASALGTPQAPGHVSINELELFPAG